MERGQVKRVECPRRECQGSQLGYLILEPDGGWELFSVGRGRDKHPPRLAMSVEVLFGVDLPPFSLTGGRDSRLRVALLGISDHGPSIDLEGLKVTRREYVRRYLHGVDPDAETFTMTCRRCKKSVPLQRANLDRGVAA